MSLWRTHLLSKSTKTSYFGQSSLDNSFRRLPILDFVLGHATWFPLVGLLCGRCWIRTGSNSEGYHGRLVEADVTMQDDWLQKRKIIWAVEHTAVRSWSLLNFLFGNYGVLLQLAGNQLVGLNSKLANTCRNGGLITGKVVRNWRRSKPN